MTSSSEKIPATPDQDVALVVRIRRGDRCACEQFVRDNYEAVFRFLFRLCGEPELAADCTQDTFQTAWQKIGSYAGESTLRSWLHRIAYHRFVDSFRRKRRERDWISSMELTPSSTDTKGERCLAEMRDTSAHLSAAVNQLPDEQRIIVALHYFEGLSLAETAVVVEEAVGTVKWRLSKALERLRSIVKAEAV